MVQFSARVLSTPAGITTAPAGGAVGPERIDATPHTASPNGVAEGDGDATGLDEGEGLAPGDGDGDGLLLGDEDALGELVWCGTIDADGTLDVPPPPHAVKMAALSPTAKLRPTRTNALPIASLRAARRSRDAKYCYLQFCLQFCTRPPGGHRPARSALHFTLCV